MGVLDFEIVFDSSEKARSAWIVQTCFRCMRFIDDGCSLPGDKATKIKRRIQSREKNIFLVLIYFPNSASKLRNYWIIEIKELRNIYRGENEYIDYVSH